MKHTNGDLLKLFKEAGIHTTEDNLSPLLKPYIAEAQNGVIDLGKPFTVVLPKLEGDTFGMAALSFLNNDGTFHPQSTGFITMKPGEDTKHVIDNTQLDPAFEPYHEAIIVAFIQHTVAGVWARVQESDVYTFTS